MQIEHDQIRNILNIKFDNGSSLSVTEEFLQQLRIIDVTNTASPADLVEKDWAIMKDEILNKDGSIDYAQLKITLSKYRRLISNVMKVYFQITGGIVSDSNVDHEVILSLADEELNKLLDQAREETRKKVLSEVTELFKNQKRGDRNSNHKDTK